MPARNMDSTVEKFVNRFYPGTTGIERGKRAGLIRTWLKTAVDAAPDGISTRKLESLFAAEMKDDPTIRARKKLGESKKSHSFYVLHTVAPVEIVSGPFDDRKDAVTAATITKNLSVITATDAKRRGFLSRYEESLANEVPF